MNRAIILPLLALVSLATPRSSSAAVPDSAVEAKKTPDAFEFPIPREFTEAAERSRGLSGYALRDVLDEVAASPEFWSGFRSITLALAQSRHAQRQVAEFMRSEGARQPVPPGVPPHLMWRAMSAASAAAEMLPSDLQQMSAVMEQAADDFAEIVSDVAERLDDRTIPVAMRRMERRALRGLAAAMVLAAFEYEADPRQYAELLSLYAEGMENAVCLIALGLDGDAAARADAIIRDLRLPPLDRPALRQRAERLAEAEDALEAASTDLDGEALRLPPDPGFREADS